MTRFPILNLYRVLFNVGAILLLLFGVLSGISNASSESDLAIGSLIATLLPYLAAAAVLGFFAEGIKLALEIERHLSRISNR